MLFADREVRIGKNCARGLECGLGPYSIPRAQFFPIRADLGRQITCLFFSSVEYFVSSFCVEFSFENNETTSFLLNRNNDGLIFICCFFSKVLVISA